jgi:hypothetical protein
MANDDGWIAGGGQKAWRERGARRQASPSSGIPETFAIDVLTIAAESDLSDDALRALVSTIAMLAHGSFSEPLPLDRELAARRWVELVARSLPGFRTPPRTTAAKGKHVSPFSAFANALAEHRVAIADGIADGSVVPIDRDAVAKLIRESYRAALGDEQEPKT